LGATGPLWAIWRGRLSAWHTAYAPEALIIKGTIRDIIFADIIPDITLGKMQDRMNPYVIRTWGEVKFPRSCLLLIPPDACQESLPAALFDSLPEGFSL
jgi:hypothetical protein